MAVPPSRSRQELLEASSHLGYEVWMLRQTAAKLSGMSPGPDRNSVLESFTIHARALYQFFDPDPKNPKPDDVFAWQYVGTESAWKAALNAMPPELADVNKRVGKEIAHLTFHRVTIGPIANGWDITAICDGLMRVLDTFLKVAQPSNLSAEFHRLTERSQRIPGAMCSTETNALLAVHPTTSASNAMQSTSTGVNTVARNRLYPSSPTQDES